MQQLHTSRLAPCYIHIIHALGSTVHSSDDRQVYRRSDEVAAVRVHLIRMKGVVIMEGGEEGLQLAA